MLPASGTEAPVSDQRLMFPTADDVRLPSTVVQVYNQLKESLLVPIIIESIKIYC